MPRSPKAGESMREHAVLVVSVTGSIEDPVGELLVPLVAHVERVSSVSDASARLDQLWYDAVIVDGGADESAAIEACERLLAGRGAGGPGVVLYMSRASLDLATRAMRLGVRDLLSPEVSRLEFCNRIRSVIESGESTRDAADREARLKRLCSKLDRARREVAGQVGELCTDLADAYQDLSEQIGELATAGELSGVLRQELDIEGLLRTFLEYLLGRVGSTNAGVFLPNSAGDFSLGAYINYDRPKATAEHELDQLAGVIAPAFEGASRVVRLNDEAGLLARFGEEAGFFRGETVVGVACHDTPGDPESECLAVICLFRDHRTPFGAPALRTVQVAAELFGKQLARVIRVHHRHKPDELWGADDDIDLAA
jgi:DNA-binding response OmpR family regulator